MDSWQSRDIHGQCTRVISLYQDMYIGQLFCSTPLTVSPALTHSLMYTQQCGYCSCYTAITQTSIVWVCLQFNYQPWHSCCAIHKYIHIYKTENVCVSVLCSKFWADLHESFACDILIPYRWSWGLASAARASARSNRRKWLSAVDAGYGRAP